MYKYIILIFLTILFASCSIKLSGSSVKIINKTNGSLDIKLTSTKSYSIEPSENQHFEGPTTANSGRGITMETQITSYEMKRWVINWDPTFNKDIEVTMSCNGVNKTITIQNDQYYYYEFTGSDFVKITFANQ
ncbi:MAG TPA: hypothetical protein PK771_05650 [Spirochaetota bacterium]|nr:hypothetical protein [Spirochaetota bacterium]